jgi:hypothetical protein
VRVVLLLSGFELPAAPATVAGVVPDPADVFAFGVAAVPVVPVVAAVPVVPVLVLPLVAVLPEAVPPVEPPPVAVVPGVVEPAAPVTGTQGVGVVIVVGDVRCGPVAGAVAVPVDGVVPG